MPRETSRKGRRSEEEESPRKSPTSRESRGQRSERSRREERNEVYSVLSANNKGEDEEFDYEADLEINPHFLDAEWLDQSRRYMKYAKALAHANKAKAQAEERVKTLRSELVNEAKGTEAGKNAATLEAFYRTDEDYKEAKRAFIDASLNADLINGAVFAFQMRKVALENMVRMALSEYYSEPNAPRDIADSVERFNELKKKSAQEKIKKRMRR